MRHYRMTLAEPIGRDPGVAEAARSGLARLGGSTEPLAPEPMDASAEHASTEDALPDELGAPLDAIVEPRRDVPAPSRLDSPRAEGGVQDGGPAAARARPRALEGARVRATVLADAMRIESAWAFAAGLAYVFEPGLYIEVELGAPHSTFAIAGGIEIGDLPVRPLVGVFVGLSPFRVFDGVQDGGVFAGARVGLAVHPFDVPVSFALDVALAIDLTRADDGFVFSVPVGLSLRWMP